MKFPASFLLISALILPACSPKTDPASAGAAAAEPAPIQVSARAAGEQPMPRYLRVTGELRGAQEAMVAADAPGKVVDAPIERGTIVKAGEVLLRLDDRSAALSLAEAEAALVSAQLKMDLQRTELARNEPLAKTKAISDTDFQRFKIDFASADASLAGSKARRDQAKKSLTDSTILAPFDGTVAERLVQLGEYVSSNSPVANLVATDRLRLMLNVPETAVGRITPGQAVTFSVPAFPGVSFTGNVKFIGAAVRNSARDLIVEAEVGNGDGKLKPGMFAEGRVALGEEPAITVPEKSVLSEGPVRKLFVVVKDRLEARLVETGESKPGFLEIARGLAKGELVVTAPGPNAADGVKIILTRPE
ncbi:MAG: efflux transporter periplasmic adaptor subunit [Verrucomicrobiales bacterium]|nr:efflux transporter periplasmic adaptor subunit [Verrucomicrobiales bacterium]